jgi:hypothetical protein
MWEEEKIVVAIIEPWEAEPWIRVPYPPMRLIKVQALQAVDVSNILAPAGRIAMDMGRKHVAFEVSEGGQAPELVEEEED